MPPDLILPLSGWLPELVIWAGVPKKSSALSALRVP